MTELFNRTSEKAKRRALRKNIPRAESVLWQYLRRKNQEGLRFRRQVSIGKYVVDFYCPKRQLVIEVDGESHLTDVAQKHDVARQKYLEGLGIRVIRFLNTDVYTNLSGVIEEVLKQLEFRK